MCGVILSCGGALHNHITRQHPNEAKTNKVRGPKGSFNTPVANPEESIEESIVEKTDFDVPDVKPAEEEEEKKERHSDSDVNTEEPKEKPDEMSPKEITIKTEPPDVD